MRAGRRGSKETNNEGWFVSWRLSSEAYPYRIDHLSSRRKHAQGGQRAAIDDRIAVDQHLELPVAATNHLHLDSQLTTNPRRHPDGMEA